MSIETSLVRGIGQALPFARPWLGPRLPIGEGIRKFAAHPASVVGVALLLPIVAIALLGPWLPLPDPNQPAIRSALQGPSTAHLFGTDALGRDLLARVVAGARVSIGIGFSVA